MASARKSFSLFLFIWAGQLLSRIGSGISAFALGVHLFEKTGSAAAYASLLICAFLPSIVLAPVGGVLADSRNRKQLMVVGDVGSALGILFVITMLLLHPDNDWPIYLGVAISSAFVALHAPAFKASVTDLLEEQEYGRASGLIQLAEASRYLLAPLIAAFLLSSFTLQLVLAIDMATFLVAALTVLLVGRVSSQPPPQVRKESFWKDFTGGVRYLAGNKALVHLLCLTTAVTFFAGILQALFAPMILSLADATALAMVQFTAASGMLLGSLLIGLSRKPGNQRKILSRALVFAALFYLLIGIGTDALRIAGAAFGFFLTLPYVNSSLEVLFRQNIANELQGRAWALISLISQGGMLVALAVAGVLVDHVLNPLLADQGSLAEALGRIVGAGPARGSGLMVIASGLLFLLYALFTAKTGESCRPRAS